MQSVTVTDSAETPELPNHSIAFEYVSRGEIDELKSYMSSQPQAMQEMDSEGFFLIHWAAYFDNIEIAEWLLQLNPYAIKACTYTRATPLHVAARRNAVKVMDLLINTPSANLSVCDVFEETPLHIACACNNRTIVSMLVEAGAPLNALDASGRIPYVVVQRCGHTHKDLLPMLEPKNLDRYLLIFKCKEPPAGISGIDTNLLDIKVSDFMKTIIMNGSYEKNLPRAEVKGL